MKTARDLMQTHVISVSPDDPLINVHRLFVDEEITGAPVVDEDGQVLGMISIVDLVRAVAEEHDSGASEPMYLRELLEFSGPDWSSMPDDFQDRLNQRTVADAMSDGIVSVPPDATAAQVAHALRQNRIHRVLVIEDGQLVGIVSTFDLTALLESDGDQPSPTRTARHSL